MLNNASICFGSKPGLGTRRRNPRLCCNCSSEMDCRCNNQTKEANYTILAKSCRNHWWNLHQSVDVPLYDSPGSANVVLPIQIQKEETWPTVKRVVLFSIFLFFLLLIPVSAEVIRFKQANDDSYLLCTYTQSSEEMVLMDFDTLRFDEVKVYIFSEQEEMYIEIVSYASRNETTGAFLNEIYHSNITLQRKHLLTADTITLEQNPVGEYIIISYLDVKFIFWHQTTLAALPADIETQGDFFSFVIQQALIASVAVFTATYSSKNLVKKAKFIPGPSNVSLIIIMFFMLVILGSMWAFAFDVFISNILLVHLAIFVIAWFASLNIHNPDMKQILLTKMTVEKETLKWKDQTFMAIDPTTPILEGVMPAVKRMFGRQAKMIFDADNVWHIKSDSFLAVYVCKSWEVEGNSLKVEVAEAHKQSVQQFIHGLLSAEDLARSHDEIQMANYELQATLHSEAMTIGSKVATTVVKGIMGYQSEESAEEKVTEEVSDIDESD